MTDDKTKQPTPQDIEAVRAMLVTHLMAARKDTPAAVRGVAALLDTGDRVLDYAAACVEAEAIGADWGNFARLRAERAGETPTPPTRHDLVAQRDSVDAQIRALYPEAEGKRVPEVVSAAGTPVWSEGRDGWHAYVGLHAGGDYILSAASYEWERYTFATSETLSGRGNAGSLAANIRAASASWNAAHPDLPPVIVPEQFREVVDVPEVEAPEDAGEQPPTDPEARVRAMSLAALGEELFGRGVGPWSMSPPGDGTMYRAWADGWDAVAPDGICYPPAPGSLAFGDYQKGDTATPYGRAECSRRLLVHLLRAEEAE